MSKIKLASVDANAFKLGGKVFLKGDYRIEYVETTTDAVTGVLPVGHEENAKVILKPKSSYLGERVLLPFKSPQPWTNFIDSSGAAYASFDAFSVALAALVAKA